VVGGGGWGREAVAGADGAGWWGRDTLAHHLIVMKTWRFYGTSLTKPYSLASETPTSTFDVKRRFAVAHPTTPKDGRPCGVVPMLVYDCVP
jgi:hypothetical protein